MPGAMSAARPAKARKSPLERTRSMPGARAQVENCGGRDLELIETRHQFVAYAFLQRGRGVVTGAGAIEGAHHGVPIERKVCARIGKVHVFGASASAPASADSASTCAFFVRCREVTQARGAGGTVGGRMAMARNPADSSARLTARARAASPRTTGTMVVVVAGARVTPLSESPRAKRAPGPTPFAPPALTVTDAQRGTRGRGHGRRARWCRCRCAISASADR